MITLRHIKKTFRVAKREAGLKNAVRSFFSREYEVIEALADVSFEIGDGEIVGIAADEVQEVEDPALPPRERPRRCD